MSSAYESIARGIAQAIEHQKAVARGEPADHLGTEYIVKVRGTDVTKTRQKTKRSQAKLR